MSATTSETVYWADKLKTSFGIDSEAGNLRDASILLRTTYKYLSVMPEVLVRACGVVRLIFESMGESRSFSPNHGFYIPIQKIITLNADMFYNPDQPDDFFDDRGYHLTRVEQTLYHEFFHALDHMLGDISLQEPWMKLSGWSKEKKPGMKRLIIEEPGAPKVVGEYWFDPKFENNFTRFYAKRNPFDDFADSGAYYIGLKNKVPGNKRAYLDKLLAPYFK